MNILVTVDKNYLPQLCVMLYSLLKSDPQTSLDVYVMNRALTEADFETLGSTLKNPRVGFHDIKTDDSLLSDAPVTDRYPLEMYYRIFAARYLPESVDRVLYLDPDLVVLRSLCALYAMDFGESYYAAASHVGKPLNRINELRLKMPEGPYINSGVMLMNIAALRKEQDIGEVYRYIDENRSLLMLPDQDVISGLYAEKIIPLDPYIYNMTERLLVFPHPANRQTGIGWVCENSAIIHYCGRNKPWKEGYIGKLDVFYHEFATMLKHGM